MSTSTPRSLVAELDALGPTALRRASTDAAAMFAADVSGSAPGVLDPLPAVISAEEWEQLAGGLTQRARLLDALYADLYGPRMVFGTDVAPTAELLDDPAYLRTAIGMPARGSHRLFALTCTVARTAEGEWQVLEDQVDVPEGAGLALEMRRVMSRCAASLYRTTELRRLHPFFDRIRTALDHRGRTDGGAGRAVVLIGEEHDPLRGFDHHWFANLLGAPVVSATDLRTGAGLLTLRVPGVQKDVADAVDTLIRLAPSQQLDPLDLGPTPLRGVTGLVEAARNGDVEVVNPLGSGLLENPALRSALPDLCRQILHEDLQLRSTLAGADGDWATIASLDPEGGSQPVQRPVTLRLLVLAGADGYEVLPGGVATTADDSPAALKDVWVLVPENAAAPDPASPAAITRSTLPAYPAMTRSIGADLFWFGRYLERVDLTARLLRTVVDSTNDLGSERGDTARTALSVLLRAITDVTTTFPGFHAVDIADPEEVRTEITALLTAVERPGSLAQSFDALAHTTRTQRDLVSDDIWPVIARMRSRIHALAQMGSQPLEPTLTDIIDGCLTLSGAITESMPRNLGWDLAETGRRIERALGLLALLRATLGHRLPHDAEARITQAVAEITESGASYRRYYHAAVQPALLLELLMADATLPRSVAFQLDRLGQSLDRLPEPTPFPAVRAPFSALRARVATWSPGDLLSVEPAPDDIGSTSGSTGPASADGRTALLAETTAAIDSLRELSGALEDAYFRPTESTSPWGFEDV